MAIPKTILFDLGDVVCDFVPERRLSAFAQSTGREVDELAEMFWHSGFSARCDVGEYTAEQMLSVINQYTKMDFDEAQLMAIWSQAFETNGAVLRIAQRLSAAINVGMLTNNAPVLRNALPIWFPEIESLFEPVLFSCELMATKPEPELFAQVENRIGVSGSQLMLIDDSPKNVAAALAAGWQAIHFDNADLLVASLQESGLLLRP